MLCDMGLALTLPGATFLHLNKEGWTGPSLQAEAGIRVPACLD